MGPRTEYGPHRGAVIDRRAMQPKLPLTAVGRAHVLHAHGVQIDFENRTIRPAHFANVGNLIGRIFRYGVMRSLRWEQCCSVLFHSALVGRIASELARGGHLTAIPLDLTGPDGSSRRWTDPSVQRLAGLYGAMHDIGEIFGGDHPLPVPKAVKVPIMEYQATCRDNVMLELGLPLPSIALRKVVGIADLLAPPAELSLCRDPNPFEMDWFERMDEKLEGLGVVGVDPRSFAKSLLGDLEAANRFPPHHRALSMWKATIRANVVLLSHNHYVLAVAGRDELPERSRTKDPLAPLLEWIRGFGFQGADLTFHDLGSLRQGGSVKNWSIPRVESAA